MKKLLLSVVCALGILAPAFAAPSVEQVQQLVQTRLIQDEDPVLVENAVTAFKIALMSYTLNKLSNQLTDNEKKIDQILTAADFVESVKSSAATVLPAEEFSKCEIEEEVYAKLEEFAMQDPNLEEKLMQAYAQNKYIKQLIALFWANQNKYQKDEVDQETFDTSVVTYALLMCYQTEMMQQLMMEE